MNIQKISVDKLNPAEYNPRKDLKPGDKEYEKLKRSIEEFGYVEPVIWNQKTGNVVGGHQRLKVLLDLGQTEIDCVVVDLDPVSYTHLLQKIYDDPAYYKELLEKNKDNLKSLQAYEKSKRKVQELLGEENKTGSKLDSIIQYLLYKCEDITPLALQKALYYVQGFYYAFEGRFLFEEDCEAWVHGPVYRDIYLSLIHI